jgi:hypothetical protein
MTELHSFEDMIAHLEAGGAAHRFGSWYPLYRMERGELKRRYFSSGGEYENGPMMPVSFSVEEQQSSDWILEDAEKIRKLDEANRRHYQEHLQARMAAEEQKPKQKAGWWWRIMR